MTGEKLKEFLDTSYARFNRAEYIDPDPLLLAREFPLVRDREIAALVASCLAVGRAPLIVKAARDIMKRMGNEPAAFIDSEGYSGLESAFRGFRYRFFSGADIASLLYGVKSVTPRNGGLGGGLGDVFSSFVKKGDETVLGALESMIREIARGCGNHTFAKNLLPSPALGSACKRPLLFLRWMIRSDDVDPGGWESSLVPLLVQPMDTHMTWVSQRFCFITGNKPANLKTALEVTRRFREINEEDPVKYDFCLTRPGIHPDLSRDEWFGACIPTDQ